MKTNIHHGVIFSVFLALFACRGVESTSETSESDDYAVAEPAPTATTETAETPTTTEIDPTIAEPGSQFCTLYYRTLVYYDEAGTWAGSDASYRCSEFKRRNSPRYDQYKCSCYKL